MLDIYRIRTRIEEIQKRSLSLRQELLPLGEKKLTKDEILYAAAERNVEVAIQASLDIANHIVAACGLERPKKEAGEVFFTLAKEKVIGKNLAEKLKEAAGFRNLLVHEYAKIDRHKTYINIRDDLKDLIQFAKEIEEFLEKRGEK